MQSFFYTIRDPIGIHARPAGLLASRAKQFKSEILLYKGEQSANAARLLAVMGLCIKNGDEVRVTVSGEDEAAACAALEEFFKEHF